MSSSSLQLSQHISVLLVDPDKDFARKVQGLLFGHLADSLDLALTNSLNEALAHLCTHRVRLILMGPAFPGHSLSDALHAVRLAAPNRGILVYGFTPDESFRLDALRAGAHEVFFIANISPDTFRLAIECALARSCQPMTNATTSAMPKLIHDLNNAITAINGFAEILLNRVHGDAQNRACAEQIRNAGARAADLISTLAPPAARQESDTCTSRAA